MKAKSVLLTIPLAMSALTFLTLPANAVCWSWKPCADYQGYGYGAPTESQAVLPPLRADGSVPPTAQRPNSGAKDATRLTPTEVRIGSCGPAGRILASAPPAEAGVLTKAMVARAPAAMTFNNLVRLSENIVVFLWLWLKRWIVRRSCAILHITAVVFATRQ